MVISKHLSKHLARTSLVSAWVCLLAARCPAQTAPDSREHHGDPYSLDTGNYNLNAPTSTEEEIDEILGPHTAMFDVPFINRPVNSLFDAQRRLEEETGLRVAFAYTQLYQQASGGPGERWGMVGDADLMFDWTLVGRGTENTGRL